MIARLWAKWKPLAQRIGDFQARVILTVLYILLLGPFALIMRLFKDPLRIKRTAGSSWIPKASEPTSLETARRQF